MIRFLDLKKVNAQYQKEFKKQFDNFLRTGNYILGEQTASFENEFANYCGTKFCIGVSSGLDALQLIFEAYKVMGLLELGDEIIVPANTYIASVLAISNTGLKPVLVEPCIETYNINPNNISNAITSKTKAILGVHLYGHVYDVDGLEKISKGYNLLLIEDAAQAHGAISKLGRRAGNLSHAAAFSFYPTKNLGALGDAGAITTNDEKLADIIFKLRNYGRISTYENEIKGYNCRLDELQAVFLNIKLKYLDAENSKRRDLARLYFRNIVSSKVLLPFVQNTEGHVFHLFVIRCEKRDVLKSYLLKNGVETSIHYPIPIFSQQAYSELYNDSFPITESIHNDILSLPLNTSLSESEINIVSTLINKF